MDILGGSDTVVPNITLSGASLNLDGNSNDAFPPLTFLADATAWVELEDQFRNSELPVSENTPSASNSNFASSWTFTQNETSDMLVNSGTSTSNSQIQPEPACASFSSSERDEVFPFAPTPVVQSNIDPLLKGEGLGFGRISSSEADRMEVARIMEQLKKGWDGTSALHTANLHDERRYEQLADLDRICTFDQGTLSINLNPLFSLKLKRTVTEFVGKECQTIPVQLRFPFGVLCIVIPIDQLWETPVSLPPPPPSSHILNQSSSKEEGGIDECLDINGRKRYTCNTCAKDYSSRAALTVHIRSHTNSRPFSCSQCSKTFKQAGHLSTHQLRHKMDKRFVCLKCPASFNQRHHLVRHRAICFRVPKSNDTLINGSDPECIIPSSSKINLDSEIIHNNILENDLEADDITKPKSGKHKCTQCGRCVHKLKRHMRLVHGEDSRPCICSECGTEFKTMQHLKQHMVIHSEVLQYSCAICFHKFKLAAHLKRHMISVHFNSDRILPFTCKTCGKGFSRKDCLSDHEATHNESRTFACDECGLKFRMERRLKFHKSKMHPSDDAVFLIECPNCDQQFTRMTNLKRHQKTACKARK